MNTAITVRTMTNITACFGSILVMVPLLKVCQAEIDKIECKRKHEADAKLLADRPDCEPFLGKTLSPQLEKMQTCDPLTARQWFKLRTATNWAVTIVVFIPLVFVLQNFVPLFIADVIAIAVAFCLFFFFLHKRAIGIKCSNPKCGKYIETNTPWICGFKQCRNDQVDDFPFVNRCQHCGAEPKAYKCHHCGELIFFTEDQLKINFAKCVNLPVKGKPFKKDKDSESIEKYSKDIQVTELQVKKAKLDLELKGVKEYLDPKKEKTQREILEESISNFEDRNLSGAEIVERKKAENAKKFKNNPAELERQNLLVDQWARDHLDEM